MEHDWFILRVLSGQDESVEEALRTRGYNVYMPYLIESRRHRRHKCLINRAVPLFPGYLFVSLNAHGNWRDLNSVRGVLGPIKSQGDPALIESAEIEQIMEAEALGRFENTRTVRMGFKVGDKVSFEAFGAVVTAFVKSFVGKSGFEVSGEAGMGHFSATKSFDELIPA